MKTIVISLGGSLLYPKEIDSDYLKKFSKVAIELSEKYKLAIVTGGGKLARNYIKVARDSGTSEAICDLLGIEASRMNAFLLSAVIGKKSTLEPPKDFNTALKELNSGKIVVMGGTHPGHSTDAVAAILAEYIQADLLINATNVDGIYNKNPKTNPRAKLHEKLTSPELIQVLKNKSVGAGKYELLDILAAKIIQRSKISFFVLNGKNLENLKKAIEGKKFKGTIIENK